MNTRKVVCLTNTKDGSKRFLSEDDFRFCIENSSGCTLRDGVLYYEHDENVPYYNS